MKILAISTALGMLCCCINNAMGKKDQENEPNQEKKTTITTNMFSTILIGQATILNAKNKITKEEKKNIYTTIKGKTGGINKKKLVDFIQVQIDLEKLKKEEKEKLYKGFERGPKEIVENYFKINEKAEKQEYAEKDFTDIFWEKSGEGEPIKMVVLEIKEYLQTIIKVEAIISVTFNNFINSIIEKKANIKDFNEKEVKEKIMKKITKDICGENDNKEQIAQNFQKKLLDISKQTITQHKDNQNTIYEAKIINTLKNNIEEVIILLKKRIFKDAQNPTQKDFMDFLNYLYVHEKHFAIYLKFNQVTKYIKKGKDGCPCPCC